MATKPMSHREKRYVEAYCGEARMNKALAARIAGFKGNGRKMGYRLYQRPHVRRAIDRRLERLSMTSGEVTRRLSDMAAGSVQPFLGKDSDGSPTINLDTKKARENIHLIRKLKVTRRTIKVGDGEDILETKVDLEIHDALNATVQMGKIRGLYIERDKNGEVVPNFKVYVGIDPDQAL